MEKWKLIRSLESIRDNAVKALADLEKVSDLEVDVQQVVDEGGYTDQQPISYLDIDFTLFDDEDPIEFAVNITTKIIG